MFSKAFQRRFTQVATQVEVRIQVEGNYKNLTPFLSCRKAKKKKRLVKGA